MSLIVRAGTELVSRIPRELLINLDGELSKLPQLELELKHMFAKGVYAREGFLPKGSVFTGLIHKQSQVNILSMGKVTVVTEEGTEEFTAPASWVSPPNTKRACYVHEDSVWTTILGTEETDVAIIEQTLVMKTYED